MDAAKDNPDRSENCNPSPDHGASHLRGLREHQVGSPANSTKHLRVKLRDRRRLYGDRVAATLLPRMSPKLAHTDGSSTRPYVGWVAQDKKCLVRGEIDVHDPTKTSRLLRFML
jgi:hypothetical protein